MMRNVVVLLFIYSILFIGCATSTQIIIEEHNIIEEVIVEDQVTNIADVEVNENTDSEIQPKNVDLKLYQHLLLPEDFDATIYMSGYLGEVTPLVVSDVIYSRAQKYEFLDSYFVSYSSNWNQQVLDYNFYFNEQIYTLPSDKTAQEMFLDLNNSLFTGSYDDVDDKPNYFYNEYDSTRFLEVRMRSQSLINIKYLKKINDSIIFASFHYPLSNYSAEYYKTIIEKINERVLSPSELKEDPAMTFKKSMIENFIIKKEANNFTFYVNNLSFTPTTNGSGLLNAIVVTVRNKNNYPFFPVLSYYVQKTDLSKEDDAALSGQVHAKWTYYSYTLLDLNEQRSFFFVEPTAIRFDENQNALFKIQILDKNRGESPFSLETVNFTIHMDDYIPKN